MKSQTPLLYWPFCSVVAAVSIPDFGFVIRIRHVVANTVGHDRVGLGTLADVKDSLPSHKQSCLFGYIHEIDPLTPNILFLL